MYYKASNVYIINETNVLSENNYNCISYDDNIDNNNKNNWSARSDVSSSTSSSIKTSSSSSTTKNYDFLAL
jgi:hypothetical protein